VHWGADASAEALRLANSPFYLMAHADFNYHEDMGLPLQKHKVTKSMYRSLTMLREHQPASIGTIADVAVIKRSTRTGDRGLEQGLIAAKASLEDKRVTEVRMTATDRQTLATLTPIATTSSSARLPTSATPNCARWWQR
jgi:DNA-binding MarR family transcriptional regulator